MPVSWILSYLCPELFFFLEASRQRTVMGSPFWNSMRAKAPERGRFYLSAIAFLNKREVAAVDPFIQHTFSKDVLHAGHLAELRGHKDALSPCPHVGNNLGVTRLIGTILQLLPWSGTVFSFLYTRSLCPPNNSYWGWYYCPWSQSWVKPRFKPWSSWWQSPFPQTPKSHSVPPQGVEPT